MKGKAVDYLVIRIRNILLYRDFFGPLTSCPADIDRDAERLYGKEGHTLKTIAWNKAPAHMKKLAKDNPENTFK